EAQARADLLAVMEPADATALLEQQLAQDWAPLPAAFKDLLRARCLDSGARVLAALAAATDAPAVLAVAERYRQRPALVVAALAALALWHWRRGDAAADGAADPAAAAGLVSVAGIVAALQATLGPGPVAEGAAPVPAGAIPALLPPPDLEPGRCAQIAALIADAGFVERLRAVLVKGAGRREWVRAQVAGLGCIDLAGLALGPHLPATRILDEIRLLDGPGGRG
ncbi:MAG TPA: hypothetical protein VES73_09085, partial [Lamprocystis sp. (in: g-proteobacteria)]|nr:hypothetical protein [Lamprocystis sp. (in: g-proteobacteria)]